MVRGGTKCVKKVCELECTYSPVAELALGCGAWTTVMSGMGVQFLLMLKVNADCVCTFCGYACILACTLYLAMTGQPWEQIHDRNAHAVEPYSLHQKLQD